MKRLCGLYQVPVSYLYEEHHGEEERNVDLIPDAIQQKLRNRYQHHPSTSFINPSNPATTSLYVASKSPVYHGSATSRPLPAKESIL